MATKKTNTEQVVAAIPQINNQYATIHIVGDAPLISHKWAEKARREMLDKQMKKTKISGKDAKDPVADFIDSLYWLEGKPEEKTEEGFAKAIQNGAKFGFPSVAFKAAAVSAGYRNGAIKNKVTANGSFHIQDEFVEIKGLPTMREDMVVIGGMNRTTDVRFRGEFKAWETTLRINYNASAITLEQIAALLNLGGYSCGVGEWRIEKGGRYGAFHVE